MCELSELSELSLGRELSPAIGDSSAGKICVISVVRVPPGESVRLMRLNGF
jgi:hypothetical protein